MIRSILVTIGTFCSDLNRPPIADHPLLIIDFSSSKILLLLLSSLILFNTPALLLSIFYSADLESISRSVVKILSVKHSKFKFLSAFGYEDISFVIKLINGNCSKKLLSKAFQGITSFLTVLTAEIMFLNLTPNTSLF